MRETGDGLERFPQSWWLPDGFNRRPQGLEGVAVPIRGMPPRYEASRLGEQEEEDPVDDRQRLVEQMPMVVRGTTAAPAGRGEGPYELDQRILHAFLQRRSYGAAMLLRQRDRAIEQRGVSVR